jgi:hypothetical protein
MLFDLRSRGRRRTVQVIYAGLACLMFFGLVLFGVGAGNGFGGLLNAFGGGGNGGAQKQAVSQQEKQALAAIKLNPNNPTAWSELVQARYTSAASGADYNSTTGQFTAAGRAELASAMKAWQHYLALTKKPDQTLAVLAARAYSDLAQYKNEADAWQIVTAQNPHVPTYFVNLAIAAYQAKDLSLGDLASAKAVALTPQATRAQIKTQLQQVRAQVGGAAATGVTGASATPTSTVTSSTQTATGSTPSTTTTTSTAKSGKKK